VQEVLDPDELGDLDEEHRREHDENDEPHVFVIAAGLACCIRDTPDPSGGRATMEACIHFSA
jgi:hypothetical protein